MSDVRTSYAYNAISGFYRDRRAERSGVLLMNHIDEGLVVLRELGALDHALRAFCLHPLFQADAELTSVGIGFMNDGPDDPYDILLAMEYRHQANAWLSDKVRRVVMVGSGGNEIRTDHIDVDGMPTPGPLVAVKNMLIADKVQNYKDFRLHHLGKHERSDELEIYFKTWLHVLGISLKRFKALCEAIDAANT